MHLHLDLPVYNTLQLAMEEETLMPTASSSLPID